MSANVWKSNPVNKTVNKHSVPLARPSITQEDIDAVVEVLHSKWLAHGEFNHRFEEIFAEMMDVPHAISMNSCTSALEAALLVAGIKGEVIIPSFTWVATANVVVLSGATPVFCEIDPATRNVTAERIAEKITPRTEAVICVHYGGQPCNMTEIVALCEKHGLFLIEDSAETIGATWEGKATGTFGVGCFSFFPTKNITTGEGGMLTCQDDDYAQKVRALIAHGIMSTTYAREKVQRPWLRAAETVGRNFRLPNPLAALGYQQMKRLPMFNERRQELARRYNEHLAHYAPIIQTPVVAQGATHVYQMYTILVPEYMRDKMILYLRDNDIGASVHFDPPVHVQPYYLSQGWKEGDLPITERLAREIITLPIYPDLTDDEQDWVIHCVGQAVEKYSAQ